MDSALSQILSSSNDDYTSCGWNQKLVEHMAYIAGCADADTYNEMKQTRDELATILFAMTTLSQPEKENT
jgi:hypothetical protein